MDFYDLLVYTGMPRRVREDLRRLSSALGDPSPYFDKSSYWYGGKGNGKTTFACHILSESLRRELHGGEYIFEIMNPTSDRYDPLYKPDVMDHTFCWFPKLLQDIKNTFNSDYAGPSESEIVGRCLNARFLVLDDIGVEMSTDWAYQVLYLIIGDRYNEMRPTIITSNLSLSALGKKFGDTRIPSRIEGMCGEHIYEAADLDSRVVEE